MRRQIFSFFKEFPKIKQMISLKWISLIFFTAGLAGCFGDESNTSSTSSVKDAGISSTQSSQVQSSAETSSTQSFVCKNHIDHIDGLLFSDAQYNEYTANTRGLMVKDRFDRIINNYGVNLIDWQGYLANPYVAVRIQGPDDAVYPLEISISAQGTSRLMFDKPSRLSASGPLATRILNSANENIELLVAIHPDRGGEFEIERYTLTITYKDAADLRQDLTLPIRVLDQDSANESPPIPIKIDTRYDNLSTRHFENPQILAAAKQAIEDWFYFFDLKNFDEVPTDDEGIWLAGVDWKNHIYVTNNEPYTGFWFFLRSFSGPYSTGYPAATGKYHQRNGGEVEGLIHRSAAHILHFNEGAKVLATLDDERWYETNMREVTDVYGLVMHEFGHAIAFNSTWQGMANYVAEQGANVSTVIDYQGHSVLLDSSYHIVGDTKGYDRLSGQSGGWVHRFPERRWMNTKLNLLVASQAGWPLNLKLTPFLKPKITTSNLPSVAQGCTYRFALSAEGGIPFYDWQIIEGALPPGFSLNAFNGLIEAQDTSLTPAGSYSFTVQLRDSDERSQASEVNFTLLVEPQ